MASVAQSHPTPSINYVITIEFDKEPPFTAAGRVLIPALFSCLQLAFDQARTERQTPWHSIMVRLEHPTSFRP
jgi:hypothetical protein